MHKLTCFPLGNADCVRIDLACGKKILFDAAATYAPDDASDKRWDLHKELRDDLRAVGRDYFDVVALTHLDRDHFCGSSEIFHFDFAKEYQGAGRIRIRTLWVPAAMITEEAPDDDEARVIQREVRYRFREGKGIRVFSRPERLRAWCDKNNVNLNDRLALITDAGQLVPEFSLAVDGVEFFVHSPFAVRQDANSVEDRNSDGIIVQAVFESGGVKTNVLLLADCNHETLTDIAKVTKRKMRPERLEWDIVKLPHHCSYLSLSSEKGTNKTTPVEEAAWVYEKQGRQGGIIISPSKPIPAAGTAEDRDVQPPHRQAAQYYKDLLNTLGGQFVVTMEHPSKESPRPVVLEIGMHKATLKKETFSAGYIATSRPAPRAG